MDMNLELTATKQTNQEKIGIYLWLAFAICFVSNILAGLISTLMSVYLPVVVTDLSGDVGDAQISKVSAYINALYLAGWAIGGFAWGVISDKIGRARSLMFSVGSYGALTVLISFASSWELVVAFRLLSGFAVGGILVITPTLLSEIWPQRSRSIVIGIDSIGFPIGIFSSGLVNYLVSDWRQAFIAGVIPLAVAVLSFWLLKESGRWQDASTVTLPDSRKFTPGDKTNLFRGSVIFGSMLIGLWGMFSWIPTWVQSLLTNTDGQTERGIAMMLLGAGGLSGGFISGWVSNALGVRRAMMVCFSGCIVMSFLLFGMNASFSPIIYAETALLSLFFGISQGLLSIYIPQLFPIHIRATATGFCFNIGRLATAAAVFFVGALVTTLGGYSNALLTFAGIFIAGFVAVYFTRDTPSAVSSNKTNP
jgi:MFS family permease